MAEVALHQIRFGILTVSDSRSLESDVSGRTVADFVGDATVVRSVVRDEVESIQRAILEMCDECDVIITTGGTGLGPRDVTPEATRGVIGAEAPGIAEMLRARGMNSTPLACLSRGVAGIVGHTLVINLPGSPAGVADAMEVLLPVLPHAVAVLKGEALH